ncbi:MAG: hypothetical protein NT051_04260 [Candidatus Micrarchaeota archaeon]|nr:hypothetical protein [Candidatus Micrarchaeota archaeon]
MLSPLEKILFDQYGEVGVRVYNLIDGEKTAEEILRETGMSEAKLVEILEFMDERGIIKLEKPAGSPSSPPPKDSDDTPSEPEEGKGEEEEAAAREPRFTPMHSDGGCSKNGKSHPAPARGAVHRHFNKIRQADIRAHAHD